MMHRLKDWGAIVRHPAAIYWLILALWLAYILQSFWSIGMTTQDQLDFSTLAMKEGYWGSAWTMAADQGRLYFLLTKVVETWLAANPDLLLAKSLAFCAFVLAPCGFAYAFFISWRHRFLFVWLYFNLAWVGFHHLPPAAYPVINDAPFLLWAIAAWLIRNGERNPRLFVPLVGLAAFLAFFQYEPVAAMSALGFAWMLTTAAIVPSLKRRLAWSVFGAALLYGLLYLAWRALHASSYDGNQFGDLSAWTVLRTTLAFTLGALPEFLVQIPLAWGDAIAGKTSLLLPSPLLSSALTPGFAGLLALTPLAVIAAFRLTAGDDGPRGGSRSDERFGLALLAAIAMLIAANGLIGLSAKYQSWAAAIPVPYLPYLTGRLALLPLTALLALLLFRTRDRLAGTRRRNYWMLMVTLIGLVGLAIQTFNQAAAPRLRANLSKWEAVSLLMRCADPRIDRVVAPTLFYSQYMNEADWGGYWGRHAGGRFGRAVEFLPEAPAAGRFARLHLYHADDGSLIGIGIADAGDLVFIARRVPTAMSLFAGGGRAWPIYAHGASPCPRGDGWVWRFPGALEPDAPDAPVELFNALPVNAPRVREHFAGLRVAPEEIRASVDRLYLLYFGRHADPGGLDYWSAAADDAQGSLYRAIDEFERIKGETAPGDDARAVFETLHRDSARSGSLTLGALEARAVLEPSFGRRWLLLKWAEANLEPGG